MTTLDVKYRVVRIPETLRDAIRAARDAKEQTNAVFVGNAVEKHLPRISEALTELGFGDLVGETRPMRLPFSDEFGTLDLLRDRG